MVFHDSIGPVLICTLVSVSGLRGFKKKKTQNGEGIEVGEWREIGEEEIGVDLIKTHYKKFPNNKKDTLHNNSDPQHKKKQGQPNISYNI